jgi:DNA repair exonuclease SbcCD ATPase subunit
MSFNNALKKVLGLGDFGEGVDDLDYFEKRNYDNPWRKDEDEKKTKSDDGANENRDDNAQGQQPKPAYTRVELPRQEVDMTGLAASKEDGVPENILKRLMDIINGNLSPHIRNNLNIEGETKAIVETLRPQFRDYETRLRKDVLDSAAERWNKERAEIIEKLKETDDKALKAYDEIEELKEKIKATENSRKGTLTRYNDLQMKMQDLMTAKEKTDMENRSLQNKMKVLQMNEEQGKGNNDKAKEELLKLNEELTKERNEAIKSKERIAQLQKQVDELRAKGDAVVAPVIGDAAVRDEEIENLSAEVAWLHHKLDETTEELERANDELAQAQELMAEIDKFEQIKQRKDDEIAELKKRLADAGDAPSEGLDDLQKANMALSDENDALKTQVEELAKQLQQAQEAQGGSAILDDLDDGIEFTGDKKDPMSLF